MRPTQSDLHVNRPLTTIATAYLQSRSNFIATRVFPNVPVEKQSDTYYIFPKEAWFRSVAKVRAPSTETPGIGYEVNVADPYYTPVVGVHHDIDDQKRANADSIFKQDTAATRLVTHNSLLAREKKWVTKYFGAGIWATDLAGVSGSPSAGQFKQWDQSGSTPVKDVGTYRTRIAELTGFLPNKLVLNPWIVETLKNHPDILDRVKYTQRGQITVDILAGLFEVDEILVPYVTENTGADGTAAAMSFVYGKHALLVYAAPEPDLMVPSGGYTFSWNGYLGATDDGLRIKRFRVETLSSDRVECEMAFDQRVVGTDLGVYFGNVIA